jgi:hypothetical protein
MPSHIRRVMESVVVMRPDSLILTLYNDLAMDSGEVKSCRY